MFFLMQMLKHSLQLNSLQLESNEGSEITNAGLTPR